MGSDGRGMPSLSGANQRSTSEEHDHLIIKKKRKSLALPSFTRRSHFRKGSSIVFVANRGEMFYSLQHLTQGRSFYSGSSAILTV